MSNQSTDPLNQISDQTSHEDYTSEIASRAAKGDEAALKELLANPNFINRVRAISVALANRHSLRESYKDARDLEQDLYIKVCQRITNFKYTASLNTWLYRVAVNLQLDRERRRKRTMFERPDVEEGPVTSPSQTKKIALRDAIDQLTDTEQRVLSMRGKGASLREIAKELGISEHQARLALNSTLKRLLDIIPARMEHTIQTDDWSSLVEIIVESQDLETVFDESLAEIDEIRSRMSETQLEIDRHKEKTRNIIGQLGF